MAKSLGRRLAGCFGEIPRGDQFVQIGRHTVLVPGIGIERLAQPLAGASLLPLYASGERRRSDNKPYDKKLELSRAGAVGDAGVRRGLRYHEGRTSR